MYPYPPSNPHGAYTSQVEYKMRGGRWHRISRVRPPNVAVIIPQMAQALRWTVGVLVDAVCAPVAAKTPTPIASVQKSHSSSAPSLKRLLRYGHEKNVMVEVTAHNVISSPAVSQKSGVFPSNVSRMVPPPSAVIKPTMTTPSRSIPVFPAVRAPVRAK